MQPSVCSHQLKPSIVLHSMTSAQSRSSLCDVRPTVFASVSIKYHGKASHASAYPWEGVNALDAAVLCYNNLSVLRQQMKPDWRVHGERPEAPSVPLPCTSSQSCVGLGVRRRCAVQVSLSTAE